MCDGGESIAVVSVSVRVMVSIAVVSVSVRVMESIAVVSVV